MVNIKNRAALCYAILCRLATSEYKSFSAHENPQYAGCLTSETKFHTREKQQAKLLFKSLAARQKYGIENYKNIYIKSFYTISCAL